MAGGAAAPTGMPGAAGAASPPRSPELKRCARDSCRAQPGRYMRACMCDSCACMGPSMVFTCATPPLPAPHAGTRALQRGARSCQRPLPLAVAGTMTHAQAAAAVAAAAPVSKAVAGFRRQRGPAQGSMRMRKTCAAAPTAPALKLKQRRAQAALSHQVRCSQPVTGMHMQAWPQHALMCGVGLACGPRMLGRLPCTRVTHAMTDARLRPHLGAPQAVGGAARCSSPHSAASAPLPARSHRMRRRQGLHSAAAAAAGRVRGASRRRKMRRRSTMLPNRWGLLAGAAVNATACALATLSSSCVHGRPPAEVPAGQTAVWVVVTDE